MKLIRIWLPCVALLALALPATAQSAPKKAPANVELVDFTQTKATSYDDLLGRAVLIEFFAEW